MKAQESYLAGVVYSTYRVDLSRYPGSGRYNFLFIFPFVLRSITERPLDFVVYRNGKSRSEGPKFLRWAGAFQIIPNLDMGRWPCCTAEGPAHSLRSNIFSNLFIRASFVSPCKEKKICIYTSGAKQNSPTYLFTLQNSSL